MPEPGHPNSTRLSWDKSEEVLRPAFSSVRQAFCFLALVGAILLLPEMISWSGLLNRRDSYEQMTESHGAYSFVAHEIFDRSEDIDILFLGSSVLFAGVNTPQVQQALSRDLGRVAQVVTFGHYFNSIDVLYMQLRDALERRRVRMVVLSIPRMPYTDGPSTMGCRFIRHSEVGELVQRLPLNYRAALYACGILRAPRDLLSIIRGTGSPIYPSSFAANLGMDKAEIGSGRDPRTFAKFIPIPPSFPTERMILSRRNPEQFRSVHDEVPFYQKLFLEQIVDLCRRKQVALVMLNIPQHAERHSDQVLERMDWKASFGDDVPVIGIPPTLLFSGLSEMDQERLRFDDAHFNANGSEFFTRAVLPAILEVYKTHAAKAR